MRLSYALLKWIINPALLAENRERANQFFFEGEQRRYKVVLVVLMVWMAVLAFFGIYLLKKAHRHAW